MLEIGMICRLASGAQAILVSVPDHEGDIRVVIEGDGLTLATDEVAGAETFSVRTAKPRFVSAAEITPSDGRLTSQGIDRLLRALVMQEVATHFQVAHAPRAFVPGHTTVPVSGRVYGLEEVQSLSHAALDFWLTTGHFNDSFERRLARFLGRKHVLTCNSGSSANLLAVAALTSHLLEDRALKPGDEVITVAAGFPTTVNPILQYGLVPVFVDVDPRTYNAIPELIAAALTERTRAIVLAHTLGNPFDLAAIGAIAREHGLWLIEDCCDALGSRFQGRLAGTFGHIASFSFYPAHHITMGEGGAVATDDPLLKRVLESIRDWGRDCWCNPGRDDTCRKRYQWQHGGLPAGYDHKYVYSHLGYNLKITDMQAAVGVAQLDRLTGFIEQRKANFQHLFAALQPLSRHLVLPEATPGSEPSWFGFPITVVDSGRRDDLIAHLKERRIDTRLLFGGNLTKQPYFEGRKYLVHGELTNTDRIMNDTFWVGVYPGLDQPRLDYLAAAIGDYFQGS